MVWVFFTYAVTQLRSYAVTMQYTVHHTDVVCVTACMSRDLWVGYDDVSLYAGVFGDDHYYVPDVQIMAYSSGWCEDNVDVNHCSGGFMLAAKGINMRIDFCDGECCSLLRFYHETEIARSVLECHVDDIVYLFLRGVIIRLEK